MLSELQKRILQDRALIATLGRVRKNAEKILSIMQRHIITRPLILAEQTLHLFRIPKHAE